MDFNQATTALMEAGLTLSEIAAALGVRHGTVRAARLPASSPSRRSPPHGWASRLAALARSRGLELQELAGELEATAQ